MYYAVPTMLLRLCTFNIIAVTAAIIVPWHARLSAAPATLIYHQHRPPPPKATTYNVDTPRAAYYIHRIVPSTTTRFSLTQIASDDARYIDAPYKQASGER